MQCGAVSVFHTVDVMERVVALYLYFVLSMLWNAVWRCIVIRHTVDVMELSVALYCYTS